MPHLVLLYDDYFNFQETFFTTRFLSYLTPKFYYDITTRISLLHEADLWIPRAREVGF